MGRKKTRINLPKQKLKIPLEERLLLQVAYFDYLDYGPKCYTLKYTLKMMSGEYVSYSGIPIIIEKPSSLKKIENIMRNGRGSEGKTSRSRSEYRGYYLKELPYRNGWVTIDHLFQVNKGVSKTTIYRILNKFIEQGLVEEDSAVYMSKKGNRRAYREHRERHIRIKQDRVTLIRFLSMMMMADRFLGYPRIGVSGYGPMKKAMENSDYSRLFSDDKIREQLLALEDIYRAITYKYETGDYRPYGWDTLGLRDGLLRSLDIMKRDVIEARPQCPKRTPEQEELFKRLTKGPNVESGTWKAKASSEN